MIDCAEAGPREFDQIAAAEEQTAGQTLQRGMGRVAADHMQDQARREGLSAGRAVIKPPVKGAGVPQLRRDPREHDRRASQHPNASHRVIGQRLKHIGDWSVIGWYLGIW